MRHSKGIRRIKRMMALLAVLIIIVVLLMREGVISWGESHFLPVTLSGTVFLAFLWKVFDFFGGNAFWDFVKGIFSSEKNNSQERVVQRLPKLPEGLSMLRIAHQEWKKRDSMYVHAHMYCAESSARVKAERRVSLYNARSSDVVMLLSASSCGKRAILSGVLPVELYPVYILNSDSGDPSGIRSGIEALMVEKHDVDSFTFFVSVKRILKSKDEVSRLFFALQRLVDDEKDNGNSLRIVISAICLNKVENESIYYFQQLNISEAMSLAEHIDERYCKANNMVVSPLALYAEKCKGRIAEALMDYSIGNPANVARFVVACAHMSENSSPLSVYERDFDKRISYLCSRNREDALHLFLLVANVVLALQSRGLNSCNLDLIISVFCENLEGADLPSQIKKMFFSAFSLDTDTPANPFDMGLISVNEVFVSLFIDSRGRFDFEKYDGTWQRGFRAILFDERLRSYREDYCYALVNSTLLANLNNALPGNRSVVPAYCVVNSVIYGMRVPDACEGNEFICAFVKNSNEVIAQEVLQFLSSHYSVMEPVEMVQMMTTAIDAWNEFPVEYVEQLTDYLIYFIAHSTNPAEWGLDVDVVRLHLMAAIECGGERGSDAAYSFGVYLLLIFTSEHEYILFDYSVADKWIGMAKDVILSAFGKISLHLKDIVGKLGLTDGVCDFSKSLERWITEGEKIVSIIESDRDFLSRAEFGFLLYLAQVTLFFVAKGDDVLTLCSRIRCAISGKGKRVEAGALQLIDRMSFRISLSRALELPQDPKPEDFAALYGTIKDKMDLESERMWIDGEVRASFLVEVVISIQAYLLQFRNKAEYEIVLRQALLSLGTEIENRFIEFTYRQKCNLLIAFAPFLQDVSTKLKKELASVFEALLRNIPLQGKTVHFISTVEFDAFTSSAAYAVADAEFFASRIDEVLPRVVFSPMLDALAENYKILWIERLFPAFSLQDPSNLVMRMISQVIGTRVLAKLAQTKSSPLTANDIFSYAIRNRSVLSAKLLRASDETLLSMLTTFSSSYNRIKSTWPEESMRAQVKAWHFVLNKYAVPLLATLSSAEENLFLRRFSLTCLNAMSVIAESGLLDATDLDEKESCQSQLLESIGFKHLAAWSDKISVDSQRFCELACSNLKRQDPLERLKSISCIADCAQRLEERDNILNELPILDGIFNLLQEGKMALSEDALMDGGYYWYDNSLINLFVCNERFVESHKEEVMSLADYIEYELPKHNGSELVDRAKSAFRRAKAIAGQCAQ